MIPIFRAVANNKIPGDFFALIPRSVLQKQLKNLLVSILMTTVELRTAGEFHSLRVYTY
ncbi:hypothetical protein CHISP_1957 [Chitinispirillum alkaliphilum]|nr:hypothetical protein CHISP_1957 [Chitinispirillum alkaliphilum]